MALVESSSIVHEIVPDPLDYFAPYNINEAYEDRILDRINPMSGSEGKESGSLKFIIHGTDWFLDLTDSYIYLALKLVGRPRTDGRTVKIGDIKHTQLSVINNIAHSIFRQIRVKVGTQIITYSDSDYAYKALFQILLNGSKESHETYFRVMTGFKKDVAGHMDGMIDVNDENNTQNISLLERRKMFSTTDDALGEFVMKPHTGICFAAKHIPPYLDVEFELVRNENPTFYMMEANNYNFNIEISEAAFYVRKYKVKSNLVFGLERALNETKLIRLNLIEGCMSSFSIPQGTLNYHNDSFIQGKIPLRIIIGLVDSASYSGSKTKNPFNFQHFKRTHIRMLKNGTEYPEPEIITSFPDGNDPKMLMAYNFLIQSVNAAYSRDVPVIQKEDFAEGYFLQSYNMAPDGESALNPHNSAYKPSNIRLEIRFGAPLGQVTQIIVYYEVINQLTIDYKRNVTVTQQ